MASSHATGVGVSVGVASVGGVFVGLAVSRAGPHQDLARDGWYDAPLLVTVLAAVALCVILALWSRAAWQEREANRRTEANLPVSLNLDELEVPGEIDTYRALAESGFAFLENFVRHHDSEFLQAWIHDCDETVEGYGGGKLTEMRTTDPAGAAPASLSGLDEIMWCEGRRRIDWLRYQVRDS